MGTEPVYEKPLISKRVSRTMLIVGAMFGASVFLSTFVPRGVPVNRLGVGLLLLFELAGFVVLHFLPTDVRKRPIPFLIAIVSTAWVATLIVLTGGPRSDFFPLFYLILVFAGAYLESPVELGAVVLLVSLGYTSHYLVGAVMRDSLRDFLVVRVPVYFAAAFSSYYFINEARRMRGEKHILETMKDHSEARAKQMEALFTIGKKVGSVLKVRYVLDTVVASAAVAIDADYATIHLLGEGGAVELAACHGLTKQSAAVFKRLALGEGVMGWVAMSGEALNLSDAPGDYRFDYYRGDCQIASLLAIPMTVGARTIGVLTVFCTKPRRFTDDEVSFMASLASEAAIAAETSRLHEQTEELSLVDALTGLYNVRKLKEELREELRRSGRYEHPCSFAMLDIDHFKNYNDTHGHTKGDLVLQKVAAIMQGQSRDVDIVFRYGGEEFCIIFPETTKHEAYEVAERMRRAIEEHYFEGEEKQPEAELTVSIGVACFPDDAISEQGLIDQADKAMYQAKQAGRNNVQLARNRTLVR